ncbi:MAG: ATP-binding protein [Bacilli bacterium]|nr:ATP-binding protein [Bacilli bacterium]
MKIIERNYLTKLIENINVPDIKVITGIRRAGKSKLFDLFEGYLKKDKANNIVRVLLTKKEYESLLDKDELYKYINSNYKKGKNNFLLVDEIQLCKGFETIINSIHDEERFNIYLTGSNAFLLSSDLATLFGGRVFEINVLPFSFKEYCVYFESGVESFDDYVLKGGMSGSYLYKNSDDGFKYVDGILKTTIIKDIIQKYKIENEELMRMIARYLMDTIGNKTSFRNIANSLTNNYTKTNDKTVASYVDYLCKSFLFYPISRFDIKGGGYLQTEKKYYLSDLSFRYAELGTKKIDYGFVYENLVCLELLRRGYEVYVGVLYNKEVDFVAVKNNKRIYIQVADDISKDETFEREVGPLLSIKDSYPKMVIARTRHSESDYKGIAIVDIATWLLE